MNKSLQRAALLAGVFVASLIIFSSATSRVSDDLTSSLQEPSLPVVSFYNGYTRINELRGYTVDMKITAVRDAITPLEEGHSMKLVIDTYDTPVSDISYEIRSLDGNNLISSGQIDRYETNGSSLEADFAVTNILDENVEYLFRMWLQAGERQVTYYTRIMETPDDSLEECLSFALEFHNNTLRKDTGNFFSTYMDPTKGDAGTMQYVDLSCGISQITWGAMPVNQVVAPIPSFKEINSSYNVITMDYIVSCVNENGENEYYDCKEYYRLRKTSTRVYVLNYERTAEKIFRGEDEFLTEEGNLLLGIRSNDVDYVANKEGNVVAFVQAGDLWCYDAANNIVSRIFSFRELDGMSSRNNWDEHNIRIVNINDANEIDFVVYGYMNRGVHEGEVGTAVYHFTPKDHTIEEIAFLPSDSSYDIMQAEMGQLIYENEDHRLFFLRQGTIYEMDLDTLEMKSLVSGLETGCYTISASHRTIAWMEADNRSRNELIHCLDLGNGESRDLRANEGEYIYPMGFMEEDFIYGIADKAAVVQDKTGIVTIPMKRLSLVDTTAPNYPLIKDYNPISGYIGGVEVRESCIEVSLLRYMEGQYVENGTDAVVNRSVDTSVLVGIGARNSDMRLRMVQLTMQTRSQKEQRRMIASSEIQLKKIPIVHLEGEEPEDLFYVYVRGDVTLTTEDSSAAILAANRQMGVVVDSDMNYVWMRARRNGCNPMKNLMWDPLDQEGSGAEKALSAMIARENPTVCVTAMVQQGKSFRRIMEDSLAGATVLELQNCKCDDLLYYISKGNPVLAMTGNSTALLITGYSATEVYCYDSDQNKTITLRQTDADDLFYAGGYRYLTYLR